MIDLKLFFNISRDVTMATNFVAKLWQNYRLKIKIHLQVWSWSLLSCLYA